nr:histone deacetylase 14 [Tanacetum cinerariifolium]
ATGEAAPKPKASARKKKGDSASSTTPPTPTPTTTVVAAPRLSAAAKGKKPARATTPTKPTDQHGFGIDEGNGSRPGVPDVPSDDSEEELSWNSSDDEDVDEQTKGREESEGDKTDESNDGSDDGNDDDNDETVKAGSKNDEDKDDNDDEEELAKNDDEDTESGKGDDKVSESERESDEEEIRQEEEESFDPIPRTPEGNELYRDVDINQGRDLQVTQNIEDSHVTLTPVHPDGLQESSSVSSFVTSMLNPISDAGVESIFTTASSPIVSLQTPTPIMTPSTIATITTSSDAPIPPTTIPSIILENLPTFNLAFRFDERLRSLETTFFEYRQTNPFVDAMAAIPGIVHQYITQQMTEAVQEAVKSQIKEQVSRILPRIEESVNATLEAEVLTRSSHSSRTSYAIAADLSEMELKKILIEKMEGNKSIQRSDEQRNLYKALVEAYDADKAILDTYGESTILKRRREDDDQEGPSARSERGGIVTHWFTLIVLSALRRSDNENMLSLVNPHGFADTMADVNVNAPTDQAPTMHHLLRKHKFHPRPDSPLHLINEEPVLGYLKFSAKGTKREVFGMLIFGNLITTDIQGEPYYQEYLAKVAKHQRYLAGETGSDPDSPAPKPAKATKKSKRKSIPGLVTKRRKPTSSLRLVDKSVAKGIPEKAPRVDDEEADVHRALEKSLKSIYDVPRGPLPQVVIKEPEFGKYQPVPETPKKKSPADQYIFQRHTSTPTGSSGHDESSSLYVKLGLTASEVESDEDVPGIDAGDPNEGYARPNPGDQDEGHAGPNPDEQDEGQAGPNPGDAVASQPRPSPVVHVGPNLEHMDLEVIDVSTQPHPEQMDKGFNAMAYPKVQENLKLTVKEQMILEEPASSTGTLSSLQHLTKDLSFGDLFFNNKPSEADNEKTTAETEAELMPLQATATETTTTTTIHLPPPQPQQSTTDSMLMKHIGELEHIMANLIQDYKHLEERLDSHGAPLYTLKNLDIPQQVSKVVDKIVTDAVDWAIQAPIWNRFRDLPEADMKEILHQRMWETNSYKTHEDHMMLYEALEKSMNRDHSEELLKDLAEACKKKKKRRDSPKKPPGSPPYQPPPPPPPAGPSGSPRAFGSSQVPPPPPLPPSTNQEGQSHGSIAPSSSKIDASAEYKAWTTTGTRLRLSVSSTPKDLQMDDDMAPDAQVYSLDDEDTENAHIPMANLRKDWWKPLKEDRTATPEPAWSIMSSDVSVPKNNWASALASAYSPPPEDSLLVQTSNMAMFMDWLCKRQGITELKPHDQEVLAFKLVKVFHPIVIHLQYQMKECHKLLTDSVDDSIIRHNASKPLPLGGPPSQVTIQSDFFFNRDLEYLRYGSKGSRPALSILKMKTAYYPEVVLEQMVPDQIWIKEECKYDIAAIAVRTHMRILSVIRIEVFSMYGYDYIKKIVLCRVDLNEHIIAEQDFNYMYPSDFEDLHLVIRQRVEEFHLENESYQTQLNLTKPRWDATGFEYKHGYMVIDSPRAVTFWDRYGVQMIMRFIKIHKFSDGTLHQTDEGLDYRVKEFKVNRMNSSLNTRFWIRKDVDRSKEFLFAIQKRLKTRRIFHNLESFVGGRVKDGDYRLLKRTK